MENPCDICLVKAACIKDRHCDMLSKYEDKMTVDWYKKLAEDKNADSKKF